MDTKQFAGEKFGWDNGRTWFVKLFHAIGMTTKGWLFLNTILAVWFMFKHTSYTPDTNWLVRWGSNIVFSFMVWLMLLCLWWLPTWLYRGIHGKRQFFHWIVDDDHPKGQVVVCREQKNLPLQHRPPAGYTKRAYLMLHFGWFRKHLLIWNGRTRDTKVKLRVVLTEYFSPNSWLIIESRNQGVIGDNLDRMLKYIAEDRDQVNAAVINLAFPELKAQVADLAGQVARLRSEGLPAELARDLSAIIQAMVKDRSKGRPNQRQEQYRRRLEGVLDRHHLQLSDDETLWMVLEEIDSAVTQVYK